MRAFEIFQVEEVLSEHDDLVVLSLGFRSAHDPLDVLHFACGRERRGGESPAAEDELYVERTDQGMACSGPDVLSLAMHGSCIELVLTEAGMELLGLGKRTRFCFDDHPELQSIARRQLVAMVQAGQSKVSVFA